MSTPVRFNCVDFGAFGVFLNHEQLQTFIGHVGNIKVKTNILPGPDAIKNLGAKLLFNKEDFYEEFNSVKMLPNNLNKHIHGVASIDFEQISSTNDNVHEFVFERESDGNSNQVYCDQVHFIFQTVLKPVNKEKLKSINVVTNFIKPLLEQLKALHEQGMYHCDIKPANIMMNGNQATLIDFGLMSSIGLPSQSASENAKYLSLGGTPYYMSPGYRRIIGHEKFPPHILSYDNFFKLRSIASYYKSDNGYLIPNPDTQSKLSPHQANCDALSNFTRTINIPDKYDMSYYLAHNDLYALGLSIQRLWRPDIPPAIQETILELAVNKKQVFTIPETYSLKPFTIMELETMIDIANKPTIQLGGGRRSRTGKGNMKRTVLGRKRTVFKQPGYGNRLFVRLQKTTVPLKDALKLEKKLKDVQGNKKDKKRKMLERFIKSHISKSKSKNKK